MIGASYWGDPGVNWERFYGAAFVAFALLSFASGCSRDERETATSEQGQPRATETNQPTDEADDTVTSDPSDAGRRVRQLVWVAAERGDQLVLVDIARGKVLARRSAPGGPHNLTVARDGTAAATLYGSDRVALVRPRVRPRFIELGGTPHDVKADGRRFIVANEAARRIDFIAGGEHVGSVRLDAEPHDLAITPSGDKAWVTLNGSDELAIVDLRRTALVRYVATGFRPHDILFAPDGRLWVTDWEGPARVFDRRGRVRGSVELGWESHHLAFTPNGREAWITDHGSRRVFVVDARTLRVLAALPVSGGPHHVAITPDGTLAAVADHESGTVVVFNVKRRSRVDVVEVGAGPHGLWAVPADAYG